MKNLQARWEKERELFCAFLKKTGWLIVLSNALMLLVYSQWLMAPELHLDPDVLIMNPYSTFGGAHVGRQGITFIHDLLRLRLFNPNFMSVFGWLSLCAAGVVIGYVLYRLGLRSAYACAVFGPLMFISPVIASQCYYFDRKLSEGIAFALCAIAVGMSYAGLLKKKKSLCLLSIPLIILPLSIYQSFAFVYVGLTILSFLLLYRRLTLMEDRGGGIVSSHRRHAGAALCCGIRDQYGDYESFLSEQRGRIARTGFQLGKAVVCRFHCVNTQLLETGADGRDGLYKDLWDPQHIGNPRSDI